METGTNAIYLTFKRLVCERWSVRALECESARAYRGLTFVNVPQTLQDAFVLYDAGVNATLHTFGVGMRGLEEHLAASILEAATTWDSALQNTVNVLPPTPKLPVTKADL